MRIALDSQAFCLQTVGGISRYFSQLAHHLYLNKQDVGNQEVGIFAPLYRNQYLKDLPQSIIHGHYFRRYPPKMAGAFVRLNQIVASRMMARWQPDIIHETYFTKPQQQQINVLRVLTVFDMISEMPELAQDTMSAIDLRHSTKYAAVHQADHVICISAHTRNDLVRIFDIAAEKTSVVYLGCEGFSSNTSVTEKKTVTVPRPYLLYVGLREGYKNFAGFIQGVASSKRLMAEFDIIAFGALPFDVAEQTMQRQLGFKATQIRRASGSDADLVSAYRNASAFVYPSKYEGFGLPPLEAMMQHCPVIASRASSIPEVIGDAGEYFDPNHTEDIAQAIERVVFSDARSKELIELGLKRAQLFTWDRCAKETLAIYQSLSKAS
jgi:glycosyltransferase involved in cell wall biosynthesis